jgi:hypothetical protein
LAHLLGRFPTPHDAQHSSTFESRVNCQAAHQSTRKYSARPLYCILATAPKFGNRRQLTPPSAKPNDTVAGLLSVKACSRPSLQPLSLCHTSPWPYPQTTDGMQGNPSQATGLWPGMEPPYCETEAVGEIWKSVRASNDLGLLGRRVDPVRGVRELRPSSGNPTPSEHRRVDCRRLGKPGGNSRIRDPFDVPKWPCTFRAVVTMCDLYIHTLGASRHSSTFPRAGPSSDAETSGEEHPHRKEELSFGTSPLLGSPWPYLVRQQQNLSPVPQVW